MSKLTAQINVYKLSGFFQVVPLMPNKEPDDEVWEEKNITRFVNFGKTKELEKILKEAFLISKNKKPAARWPGVDRERWSAPGYLWMIKWFDDSSFTVTFYTHGEDIDWVLNASKSEKFTSALSFPQIADVIEEIIRE